MKPSLVFHFFIYLSCFLAQSYGTETEALDRLYKGKKQGLVTTDTSFLDEKVQVFHESTNKVQSNQKGLKEKDKITRLPGQPNVKFDQYSGYVTVDESAGRAFFYYLVEAEHSNQSKPLLLWLNGGPGCSSLAYGAMAELGPFRVHSDSKSLYKNPYAWNKVANVLFLESPAGVGFSYSNSTSDYAGGDQKTAADNLMFMLNWLERFPEYKNRDFYISGESYAGHYVPQLAHSILQHNKMAKNIINLKGIIIGNAVINDETDERGMYDFFWTHALSSDEDYFTINKYCDFSPNATKQVKQCSDAANDVQNNVFAVDIYNIYAPRCHSSNLTAKPKPVSPVTIDPCNDYYVYAYLNRPDVQEAIHANVTKLDHDWEACSNIITWHDSPTTVLPLLQEFMENGIRVWVFSGDTDGRVPVTSTKYSLSKLKLPVKTSWHPWYINKEVGGYTEEYKGDLTFATVRGAGHQVPSYQPTRALALIKYFLDGKPLPGKNN